MSQDIPPRSEYASLIAWDLANPGAIDRIITIVNGLQNAKLALVQPGGNNRAKEAILFDDDAATIALALQFPGKIADPTGGATQDAEVRAAMRTLLGHLRTVKQLPA